VINLHFIEEIARRVGDAIPPGARETRRDIEKNVRAILHASFEKLELVTRDEFELQAKVLEHTRSQLIELERHIAELEKRLAQKG